MLHLFQRLIIQADCDGFFFGGGGIPHKIIKTNIQIYKQYNQQYQRSNDFSSCQRFHNFYYFTRCWLPWRRLPVKSLVASFVPLMKTIGQAVGRKHASPLTDYSIINTFPSYILHRQRASPRAFCHLPSPRKEDFPEGRALFKTLHSYRLIMPWSEWRGHCSVTSICRVVTNARQLCKQCL